MSEIRRYKPNLIITGTPGCGKSTTSELLQRNLPGFKYYDVSSFAKEHNCYDGYDEGRKSHIVDEDKLLDELEPLLQKGGSIIDWHCNDIFPERLIDLVVVLRCDNSILYDRLNKRGYHDSKIQENLDAEIMGVLLQDAQESYEAEIVVELQSNDTKEMEANVDRITEWEKMWLKQHKDGVSSEPPKKGEKTVEDNNSESNEDEEEGEEEEEGENEENADDDGEEE